MNVQQNHWGTYLAKPFAPLLLVAIMALSACVKEGPQFPIIPAIELKSLSDSTITTGSNLKFILSFTDGDGDFGIADGTPPGDSVLDNCSFGRTQAQADTLFKKIYNNPTLNVYYFVIRNGDSCLEYLGTAFIPEQGKSKSIQGEIEFETNNFFCAPLKAEDTLQIGVKIKDRAGNFSNYVKTPPVVIKCQ